MLYAAIYQYIQPHINKPTFVFSLFEIEMLWIWLAIENEWIDECSCLKWRMCLCFIKMASASLLEYTFALQCHILLMLCNFMNRTNTCINWRNKKSKTKRKCSHANTGFSVFRSIFSISVIRIRFFSFLFWLPDFLKCITSYYIFLLLRFASCHATKKRRMASASSVAAVAATAELLQYARTRTVSDVIWTSFLGRHTSKSGVWCAPFSFMILLDCYWIFDTFQLCVCSSLAMFAYA